MRYIGGKCRQAKAIVEVIRALYPTFRVYVEPFCGAMWSASAVIAAFPGRRYLLSDSNPYLIRFWQAAVFEGLDPPKPGEMTEELYLWYREHMPEDDPLTGYVGFAYSFAGNFFGTPARCKTKGFKNEGSYNSTMKKLGVLRGADVEIKHEEYGASLPLSSLAYLDPPYEDRTPQVKMNGKFDSHTFRKWAELQSKRAVVITSEFLNPHGWPVLHNWGDTVVRHYSGKEPDGTVELLMRVVPTSPEDRPNFTPIRENKVVRIGKT